MERNVKFRILMHLLLERDDWLDNVKNLRQYILRYTATAGNSLTSLITSHSLDDMRHYAACNAPIWDETAEVH